jgi:hypothetical protein
MRRYSWFSLLVRGKRHETGTRLIHNRERGERGERQATVHISEVEFEPDEY